MAGKLITLVTGANTGLGWAIVNKLYESSQAYEVIVAARSLEKANATIAALPKSSNSSASPLAVDLESDDMIHAAAAAVQAKYGKLDILINNGGAQFDADMQSGKLSTRAGWNKSWDVNVTGTHIMTTAFAPLLLKSSSPCVCFLTSGLSTMEEAVNPASPAPAYKAPPKGWPKPSMGYASYRQVWRDLARVYQLTKTPRSTKAGMNMMFVEWARLLREDGVRVGCVSPGLLATNLGGTTPEAKKAIGAIPPEVGAGVVMDVIEGRRDKDLAHVIRINNIQPF